MAVTAAVVVGTVVLVVDGKVVMVVIVVTCPGQRKMKPTTIAPECETHVALS